MTKTLEKAFDCIKQLSDDRQDEFAQMILDAVAQEDAGSQLTPSQQEEVLQRINEPNPVFASDEQVEALFRKYSVQ